MKNLSQKLLVGITGYDSRQVNRKIGEIDKYKIFTASLFLQLIKIKERQKIYKRLQKSNIKNIPLVHIRDDMTSDELKFLSKSYGSRYFTIHESHFSILKKWKGFYKNLYLEMNKDNFISKNVQVEKIGGFCVDLSHFKAAEEAWTKEFLYTLKRADQKIFACNHLNGYSYRYNADLHTIRSLSEFDYLKTLPKFLFGKWIAIETFNSIKKQLEFKKYLIKFLDK